MVTLMNKGIISHMVLSYPPWSTFAKTVRKPKEEAHSRFAKEQESTRKDIERAFVMLQSRWAIVCYPARTLRWEH
jgi:hypothetical protein